ncbi:hypothetical protein CLU88_3258 [Acidovorax sp. 56]|uniref:hypothetical protein n=1 Tax=Acidovorax sp. 56 TaxID=2035205 RepID=UPI000C688336|nr:hypothetical protein [Acidovorax sp. 56]PIF28350.1 hypothetical protein CLU88_3258 [Acidovorax sp. 56]
MQRWKTSAAVLALGMMSCAVSAQTTVATWNVAWLMAKPTYDTWTSTCKRYGWPSDVSKITDASLRDKAREELKGLPYCNVHNGMVFPPDSCLIEDASKSEGWPDAPRYGPNHPCRVSLDLSGSWSQYEIKLQHLRKMAAELAKAKVNVLVLQEVFDEDAVRQILPPHWEVRSTKGMAGSPDIPQQLAVAYPKDNPARVRNVQTYGDLSKVGLTRHAVRPGLDFTADVAGKPVRFLGVHLKAGCRSADITNPVKRDYHTAEDYERLQSECNAMLAQVPVLERWIEERADAKEEFVVLGDFNRNLQGEASKTARSDNTDPKDPLTCDFNAQRGKTECSAPVERLLPEISDDKPAGASLIRAFFTTAQGTELKMVRGQYPENSRGACVLKSSGTYKRQDGKKVVDEVASLAHDGIDHVLVSAALAQRLNKTSFVMNRYTYRRTGETTPMIVTPQDAVPSDHCPHFVTLGQ